jgi:hypothetical protein
MAAPAHAAPAWLTSFPISTPGTDNGPVRVAMSQNGDVGEVWRQSGTTVDSIQASIRPAGGSFRSPQPLDSNGDQPQIGMDANGNAMAVWVNGVDGNLFFSRAAAGGSFAKGTELPGQTSNAVDYSLAVAPSGEAICGWRSGSVVSVAFAAPGAGFGSPQTFSVNNPSAIEVAISPTGEALLAYEEGVSDHSILKAAVRPPGGTFGTPQPISPSDEDAEQVSLALNSAGQGIVAWSSLIAVNQWKPEAVFLAPGGDFSSVQVKDIAAITFGAGAIGAAIDPSGAVRAVWNSSDGSTQSVLATTAPFGGPFDPSAQTLSSTMVAGPELASDAAGGAIAVWLDTDGTNNRAAAAVAPAGQPFGSKKLISPPGAHARNAVRVAVDGRGNGVASWPLTDPMTANDAAQVAGYDGAGPQLRAVSVPVFPEAGTPSPFSVNPVDVWSPIASTVWTFGDGQQASGPVVTHTYATPGLKGTSVTSTDSLGNATTDLEDSEVQPDKTKPLISEASLSRKKFRAAKRGASLATKVGTTIRLTLSEPAGLRFRVERCAKFRKHKCRRYKLVKGSFSKAGKAGANSVRFTGRVRHKKLKPGLYRLRIQSVDKTGNKSKFKRLPFRIVKR